MAKDTDMVDEIESFINKYVIVPDSRPYSKVMALYVIHTWSFSTENKMGARATPYLYINSPDKQSGKSRLLEVLDCLVCNPMRTTNVTSAVLFHAIEKLQPTLLLDEVDAVWHGQKNEELRGILNGGYKEGGHVWRMNKGEPKAFNTFSPKVLAGINNGYLPDTIADRSIPVTLQRKTEEETIEDFYSFEAKAEIESLLDRIAEWATENEDTLRYYKAEKLENASDRQWEIVSPLVAIGELLGVKNVREDISSILDEEIERNTESPREELLRRIKNLFELKDTTKLFTQDIIEHLEQKDKGWNAKRIADVLRGDFDVESKNIRIGNTVRKGYDVSQFTEHFDRLIG